MAPRRIGQILVDLGFLTDEQLEIVLEEQEQQPGALLGKIAEDMQLITDEQLIQALAEQMGMQTVSLEDVELDDEVLGKDHRDDGAAVPRRADQVRETTC